MKKLILHNYSLFYFICSFKIKNHLKYILMLRKSLLITPGTIKNFFEILIMNYLNFDLELIIINSNIKIRLDNMQVR
jgi:hypothetical protein